MINHFLHVRHGIQPSTFRYAVSLNVGAGSDGEVFGQEFVTCSSLGEIDKMRFDFAQIVDIHHLAESIPEPIQGLLIAADENEIDDVGQPGLLEGLDD